MAALIGAVAALAFAQILPREYTAEASFIPDVDDILPQGLGSLVGQLGMLPGRGLSPRLAGDLITNRSVLTQTAYESFPVRGGADSVRLLDEMTRPGLLGRLLPAKRDSARVELRAMRRLRSRIAADVNERTRLVTVIARFRDPVLAAAVANRLVDRIDEFNTHTNQTRAGSTRRFMEERTRAAGEALRRAEAALQEFYSNNRDYERSPRLTFEATRLRREVDVQQQVYLALVQKLESARIDEVKDTPVLTRVDIATPPAKESAPKATLFVIGGALLATIPLLGRIMVRGAGAWYRDEDPAGYAGLVKAIDDARSGLPRILQGSGGKR